MINPLRASILGMLGVFATNLNQHTQAYDYLVQSLEVAQAISDMPVLTENLFYVAELIGKKNKLEQAVLIASFVAHHGTTTGSNQTNALKFIEELRPQFLAGVFESLCIAGQTRSLEQVLELVLASVASTSRPTQASGHDS